MTFLFPVRTNNMHYSEEDAKPAFSGQLSRSNLSLFSTFYKEETWTIIVIVNHVMDSLNLSAMCS